MNKTTPSKKYMRRNAYELPPAAEQSAAQAYDMVPPQRVASIGVMEAENEEIQVGNEFNAAGSNRPTSVFDKRAGSNEGHEKIYQKNSGAAAHGNSQRVDSGVRPSQAKTDVIPNGYSVFVGNEKTTNKSPQENLIIPSSSVASTALVPDKYQAPIASTDYVGIEKLDPRLADRVWRLNNLYHVINEKGVLVKFKLRPAQEKLLKNLHYRNIILKARQLGFTTFICIFILDYALFNKNKLVGIVAHTQTDATVIFRKVKIAWDNFPKEIKDYFKLGAVGDSKSEYEFTNGSVMRIATSLRSGTYQAILITEYGKVCAKFPEKAEEIKTGTLPAVPAEGLVFIESTAEGEGGVYYDLVDDARKLKRKKIPLTSKDFKFFFFPWYQNPANQVKADSVPIDDATNKYLDELEEQIFKGKKLNQAQRNWYYLEQKIQKEKMKQEHPSTPDEAFMATGNKLFPADVIKAQRNRYVREPIEVRDDYEIYDHFRPGHVYGLGADVAKGVSRDSSTMCVFDFTTGEVAMTYASKTIDPVMFAYEIKKGALMYGGCLVAPEANEVGFTTCTTLNTIYDNIFTQMREGMREEQVTQKLGFLTTPGNKPKMMYELSTALEIEDVKVTDDSILIEAGRFKKEDAEVVKTDETTTRHFDKLMALAIVWQLRTHVYESREDPERVKEVEARRERNVTRTKSNYR